MVKSDMKKKGKKVNMCTVVHTCMCTHTLLYTCVCKIYVYTLY